MGGMMRMKTGLGVKFGSFDEFLEKYPEPVLVDFYATWCGPCQLMQKELKKLSDDEELAGVLKVAKIDVDKYPALGSKYDVEGLPTTILFHKGEVKHRFVGLVSSEQILYELTPFLKSGK